MIDLHTGDCREVLRRFDACGFDACVTDPPYEFGFMGKRWDSTGASFDVATWREVFRVLKPGAHLLAFGGTRTYHRMTCAIEDAGFEIRDCLMWVYGSGFPKSLDVSKAIDKARTEDVEHIRAICRAIRAAMDAKGLKSHQLVEHFGGCHPRLIDHWAARDTDSQPSLPTWEQWQTLRRVLDLGGELDVEVARLNGRKGEPGDTWKNAEVLGEHEGQTPGFLNHRFSVRDHKIRSASDAAREWQGWGTALKPALEPIVLARKPLDGTVAENVCRHGTGALNVDACRIGTEERTNGAASTSSLSRKSRVAQGYRGDDGIGPGSAASTVNGRWPANLIHDGSEEVVALFPREAGAAAPVTRRNADKTRYSYGAFAGNVDEAGSTFQGDSGSAARFFYTAKVSASERGRDNTHPTVKPLDLMRYLCKLVTPPGGTIIDPFAGSGSTAIAAAQLDMHAVCIDLEAQHVDIQANRIRDELGMFIELRRHEAA